jgi:rare lipoprotein A
MKKPSKPLVLRFPSLKYLTLLCLAVFLSACAETQLIVHTAKRVVKQSKPVESTIQSEGKYKIGNPYQIKNVWYYPAVDYEYDETGIASWYGQKFHGRQTANGEIYNMNDLTAAHKTLPLPSWVEVTNLENGRQIRLRLNDRGPYAKSRIIDVSRRGAQLLGFQINGTAKVRVRILARESRQLAARMKGGATIEEVGSPITIDKLPTASVNTEPLAPPPGAKASPQPPASAKVQVVAIAPEQPVTQIATQIATQATQTASQDWSASVVTVPFTKTNLYIHAGSFTRYENALRTQAILSQIGDTKITQALVNDVDFFRVRIGPVIDVLNADSLLERAILSGFPDARIIVD